MSKKIKICSVILFLMIITVPLCRFDFREHVKSNLDNRMLTENPFSKPIDPNALGTELSAYFSDRMGFRGEAVYAYTALNNSLFRVMEHPYYMKGQDGYIFIRKNSNVVFTDFHRDFADMIVQIDRYCKKRGVPFLFVFEPEKLSVMREFAPVGMNYDDSWVDEFLDILDQNGVDYVDNTVILTQKHREGIPVFNRQYDAGHWNDIGAFYGVNCILEGMQRRCPQIKLNTEDEFSIGEKQERDLQQNGVMVEEKVPEYKPKVKPEVLTKKYKEGLKLDPSYRYFYYSKRDDKQSPKTLMFQGSYMNTRGYKFMANALNEYIAVHDYQNIFDFEYYYEKFKPEYVVFEVAEYTFLDLYFNTEKLKGFSPE